MTDTNTEALESQQAEAEADSQEYVLVAMGEDTYRVIPQKQWRISFLRYLNEGDFEAWAECVMHPEDAETFIERDPTLDEFKDFSKAAAKASGDGLGKSSGRRRS